MGFDLAGKRLAVLGAGKIGGILLRALLTREAVSAELTYATVPTRRPGAQSVRRTWHSGWDR